MLRDVFKNRRLAIKGKTAKSTRIIERLISLDVFAQSNSILLYYSSPLEVSTKKLINRLLLTNKQIYLPSTRELKVNLIYKNTEYIEKLMGIKEPKSPSSKLPATLDVAIVPGLAFDTEGYRLGYGGGWYDKILEEINVKTIIGLCFQEQLVQKLPAESHDKPVDVIITDIEVFRIK